MTTRKTSRITDVEFADFLTRSEGYEIHQKKAGILPKSELKVQPKAPINNDQPTEPSVQAEETTVVNRRVSQKQRKASLEEYKNSFLNPPKIIDRKTVYLSAETRNRLDEIVRRLGERGNSVSGFIENMAKEHLESYQDEIDQWEKL